MPEASIEIVTVPCLSDNYAFLIHDNASGATAVVDVPEARPIKQALDARGWVLHDILITHHHPDHIDGVAALVADTGARVTGARADAHRLPPLDRQVAEGDRCKVAGTEAQVIDVPGHTIGHVAYYLPDAGAAFTADSLMALGCGRLFEGTPEMMLASLTKLAALPPETLIFSGHEYTAANARFALALDPDNSDLISRVDAITLSRSNGEPTVPSTLALELKTNPFLRSHVPSLKRATGIPDVANAQTFAEIRARKDRF